MSLLLCDCGHMPAEHLGGEGRCTGRCWDDHYDTEYRCLCAAFETKGIA